MVVGLTLVLYAPEQNSPLRRCDQRTDGGINRSWAHMSDRLSEFCTRVHWWILDLNNIYALRTVFQSFLVSYGPTNWPTDDIVYCIDGPTNSHNEPSYGEPILYKRNCALVIAIQTDKQINNLTSYQVYGSENPGPALPLSKLLST